MMDPLFCLCGSPALFARLFLTLSFSLSFCVSLWPPPFLSVSPLSVHFTLSPGPPPASLLILEHFQFISLYITSFNGFFISVVMMMPISACSSRRRAPADQPLGNVSFFFSWFHLVPSFTAPRRDAARSHGSPIRGPFLPWSSCVDWTVEVCDGSVDIRTTIPLCSPKQRVVADVQWMIVVLVLEWSFLAHREKQLFDNDGPNQRKKNKWRTTRNLNRNHRFWSLFFCFFLSLYFFLSVSLSVYFRGYPLSSYSSRWLVVNGRNVWFRFPTARIPQTKL